MSACAAGRHAVGHLAEDLWPTQTPPPSRAKTRVNGDDDPERDHVDEQEDESFPASDPHSDWAGGPLEPFGD